MRISDWSSDVCSSDLGRGIAPQRAALDAVDDRREPKQVIRQVKLQVRDRVAARPVAIGRHCVRLAWDVRRGQPSQASTSAGVRSEEHTSELQSLMRISYAVFCLKKKPQHEGENRNRRDHKRQTNKIGTY